MTHPFCGTHLPGARWAVPALLLGAALYGCASAPAVGSDASAVRVMIYNIHAGKDAGGVDNLDRVAALVRETNADLVLLQEVDQGTRRSGNVDQPAALAARTGFRVAFGSALDYDGGEYGVAILSRWPILSDTLIHLPVEPPQARAGGSHEPRGALRARIDSPHGRLTVFTTHIDASADDHYRRQEGRIVASLVADALHRDETVLLGGDLNSTPESVVQQELRANGLRDAFAECGTGTGLTYPADSSIKRIDYLYLTGRLRCERAEVIATQASDHRPLIVTVLIPRNE
jgi:endonuclease/exonuclease/phosphatase family metal-dependent hydrolase